MLKRVGCLLLICFVVVPNSFGKTTDGKSTVTVIRKELSDGRTAIIEKEIRIRHRVPTEAEIAKYKGSIGEIDLLVQDVTIKIHDKKGKDTLVWRKIFEQSNDPSWFLGFVEFVIQDVVENGDRFAIMYSTRNIDVEIVSRNKNGAYEVVSKNTVFKPRGKREIKAAKLLWLGDVYALISSLSRVDIWRIQDKSAEQVYTGPADHLPNYGEIHTKKR